MAVIVLIAVLLTRNLKIVPTGKRQVALETCVGWIRDFCRDNIGPEGDRYMCYLGTVLIYIGTANIIGMFGMKPPTKDLSVTIGLALMSICLIEGATLRKHHAYRLRAGGGYRYLWSAGIDHADICRVILNA